MEELYSGKTSTTENVHVFKAASDGTDTIYNRYCDYQQKYQYRQFREQSDDLSKVNCRTCKRHPAVKELST